MSFEMKCMPCKYTRISQPYKKLTHKGIDLASPKGTPIYAVADGTVVCASANGKGWDWSYGKEVAILHEGGTYTNYAHCSLVCCKVGQKVKSGDKIAEVGNTGRSFGNHLHFEIHLGKKWNRIDPKPYMDNIGRPTYVVGKTYVLQTNMNIRIGHSTDSPKIGVDKWTKNAQSHATEKGLLEEGTKVTVREVYKANGVAWVKTPSGWICGYDKTKVYIR